LFIAVIINETQLILVSVTAKQVSAENDVCCFLYRTSVLIKIELNVITSYVNIWEHLKVLYIEMLT